MYDEIMLDETLLRKSEEAFAKEGLSFDEGIEALLHNFITQSALKQQDEFMNSTAYRTAAIFLSEDFFRIYFVHLDDDHYIKYSRSDTDHSKLTKVEGNDFFDYFHNRMLIALHPNDLPFMKKVMERNNIIAGLRSGGALSFVHRSIEFGVVRYHTVRIAAIPDEEHQTIVVALANADHQVLREQQLRRQVKKAESKAKLDALTGLFNKREYDAMRKRMDRKIAEHMAHPFAVVMADLNDLKTINDTLGHLAGDAYIKEGSSRLQKALSPAKVYRIGGDEFAIVLEGQPYRNRDYLIADLIDDSFKAIASKGCVIALGLSVFNPEKDKTFSDVFLRADMAMYENKAKLKAMH